MRLPIYRKGTSDVIGYAKEITITDKWMEDCYATLVLDDAQYVELITGDYVIYNQRVFTFDTEHNVAKNAREYSTGNAFAYKSIRFDGIVNELKRVEMLDFSTNDINTHYSWLPTFSFFCVSVNDFLNIVQANLDRSEVTRGKWICGTVEKIIKSTKNVQVSIDKENIFEALKKISTVFFCSYSIRTVKVEIEGKERIVNKIIVDENVPESETKGILSYGKDNGFVDIERQLSGESPIVNKLHAYGGTENMSSEYYSGRAIKDEENGYRLISRDYTENYFKGIHVGNDMFAKIRRRLVMDMPRTTDREQKSSKDYTARLIVRARTLYYIEFDCNIPYEGLQGHINDREDESKYFFENVWKQGQDKDLIEFLIAHNKIQDSFYWPIFDSDNEGYGSLEIKMAHSMPGQDEFTDNKTWCILRNNEEYYNDEENLFAGMESRVCPLGVKTVEQTYEASANEVKGGWDFNYVEGSEKTYVEKFHDLFDAVDGGEVAPKAGCVLKMTCDKTPGTVSKKVDLNIAWQRYYGLSFRDLNLYDIRLECSEFDTAIYNYFRKMYSDALFTDNALAVTRLMLPDFGYLAACAGYVEGGSLDIDNDKDLIERLGGVVYLPFTSRVIREITNNCNYYMAKRNGIGYREDGTSFEIKAGEKYYVVKKGDQRLRKLDTNIKDEQSIAEYGPRESSVYFDSDDAANNVAQVIPTFKAMLTEDIKKAGYDISEHPNDNGFVDEVLGGCKPYGMKDAEWDDGLPVEGEVQNKKGAFYFYIKDPGFNIANYANGNPTIHFTSGECEGRDFTIANVKHVALYCKTDGSDVSEEQGDRTEKFYGYRIECNRESDSSLGGVFFPNANNLIHGVEKMTEKSRPEDKEEGVKHSDTFVITGIFMPRVYVDAAAQKLKQYAEEYVRFNKRPRYTFTPKLNNVYLAKHTDVAASLVAGSRFYFDAQELSVPDLIVKGKDYSSLIIDSITIKDGNVPVPEYSIVLKEVKEYTALQKLKMGLGNVEGKVITSAFMQNQSISTNESYISGMVAAFVESCLSKYDDDVAEGHITFANGITSTDVKSDTLHVSGESVQEEIHSEGFEKGFKGHGLYKDNDGKWHFETDVLNVRGRLEANEIVVQESRHIGGEIMLTAAGCELAKVIKRDNGDFVCLYRTDDGVTIAGDNWEVGDQAFCEAFNVANSKVDETNYTQQRYWRLVTEVGSGISIGAEYGDMRYIVLSGSDCEAGSTEPMAGDSVVQLGNRNHADGRTGCTIISGAGTRMGNYLVYEGITRYVLPEPKVRISPDKVDITADNIKLVAAGGEKSDLQQELERLEQGIEGVDDMLDNKFDIYHIARESMKKDGEVYPSLTPVQMSVLDRDLRWDPSQYDEHIGDFALFSDGVCYRFDKRDGVYAWYLVTDAYLIDYVQKVTEQQRIFDAMAADDIISMQEKNLVKEILNRVDSEYITILGDAQYVGIDEADRTAFEQSARALIAILTYVLNTNTDVAIGYNTESGKKLAVKFWPGQQTIGFITYSQYDVAEVVPVGQSLAGWSDYNQTYRTYIELKASLQSETQRQTYQRSIEVTTSQEVINDILGKIESLNREEASTKGTVTKMEEGLGAFFTTDTAQWGVKNTSGLLTTSNFASLFASSTFTDGKQVAAQIAAYVNAEGSGIVLNADKIDFSSYSFNLKTHDISIESVPFNLNNERVTISTDNFKLDEAGNVDVKGVIRSNQMYTETNTIVVHDDEIILGSSDQYKLTNTIELRKESTYASGIVRMPDAADYKGMVVRIHGGISTNGTSHGAKIKLTMWNKDPQYSRRQIMFTFTQDTVSNLGVVELLATSEGWAILHTQNVEISGLN